MTNEERQFFGRETPLAEMVKRYNSLQKGEFIIIYGRRRLGKSELAKEFLSKTGGLNIKFHVPDSSKEDVFQHFERDFERDSGHTAAIRNWEDLFRLIAELGKQQKVAVIFDEVQRFHTIDRAFFSDLQAWWDDKLKHLPVFLVFVGSSIGLMKKVFMSASSPLYARKTWSYQIEPFTYRELRLMFADMNEEQRVELYSVFGGTPAYLAQVKHLGGSTIERIDTLLLTKGSPLYDEPAELLRTELRRSDRYNAILHAIGCGKQEQKLIADAAGFSEDPNQINPYLDILRKELSMIRRTDPVGGAQKKGRYVFRDNFFHFWYRYIHPQKSIIEMGNKNLAREHIETDLQSFIGRRVEDMIHELFIALNRKTVKTLDLNFTEIGRWWTGKKTDESRETVEIDIVAPGPEYVLLGEIEWQNRPAQRELMLSLLRKSRSVPFKSPQRYILISKSGFDPGCTEEMKKNNCVGLTLHDITSLYDSIQ